MSILMLRELLAKPPADVSWRRLVGLFRRWSDEEGDREMGLMYAQGHLATWHPKYCQGDWRLSKEHPCWGLVKHIEVHPKMETQQLQEALSASPEICSLGFHAGRLEPLLPLLQDNPSITSLVLSSGSFLATQADKVAEWLASLPHLRSLVLKDSGALEALSFLEPLTQLTCLHINNARFLSDHSFLQPLQALEELEIYHYKGLSQLDPLGSLSALRRLRLQGAHRLASIDALEDLPQLEWLLLRTCPRLQDVDPVASLEQLHTLDLYDNVGLRHTSGLMGLPTLSYLHLGRCFGLQSFHAGSNEPLRCMPTREEVAAYQATYGPQSH